MTNDELARLEFASVAAEMRVLEYPRAKIDNFRFMLKHSSPEKKRAHAIGFRRQADAMLVSKPAHAAMYRRLAEVFELATTPTPKQEVDACCRENHDGALARGSGDRREDCARVGSCLTVFIRKHPTTATAHCPRGCTFYKKTSYSETPRGEIAASVVGMRSNGVR